MRLSDKEQRYLDNVIDYLYCDTRWDYEDRGMPPEHIFVSVLGLKELLMRGSPSTVSQPITEPLSRAPDLHLVTD